MPVHWSWGRWSAICCITFVAGTPERVDHANASRTLLWDLHTRDWSKRLLELFAIPRALLPACQPICSDYGRIRRILRSR